MRLLPRRGTATLLRSNRQTSAGDTPPTGSPGTSEKTTSPHKWNCLLHLGGRDELITLNWCAAKEASNVLFFLHYSRKESLSHPMSLLCFRFCSRLIIRVVICWEFITLDTDKIKTILKVSRNSHCLHWWNAQHHTERFLCKVTPSSSQWLSEGGTLILSILELTKLRHGNMKELTHVLTAQEGCSLDSNPAVSDTSPDS